jgi:hypothetical protein
LEEGAERIFLKKKSSLGQEEGEGKKSLTRPKLTNRQVPIKNPKRDFLDAPFVGAGSLKPELRDNRQRSVRVFNNRQLYYIRPCWSP